MRKFIAIVLLLVWPSCLMHSQMLQGIVNAQRPAGSAGVFTHISTGCDSSNGGGTTIGCTLGATPTLNNTVACVLFLVDAGVAPTGVTVVDSATNAYTQTTPSSPLNSPPAHTYGFYLLHAPGTATTLINVSWTQASIFSWLACDEFHNSTNTQTFDKDAVLGSTASGTSIAGLSITPTNSGSLLSSGVAPDNSITAPTVGGTLSGWTGAQLDGNGPASEFILNQTGAKSIAYTTNTSSDPYQSIVFGFKP